MSQDRETWIEEQAFLCDPEIKEKAKDPKYIREQIDHLDPETYKDFSYWNPNTTRFLCFALCFSPLNEDQRTKIERLLERYKSHAARSRSS